MMAGISLKMNFDGCSSLFCYLPALALPGCSTWLPPRLHTMSAKAITEPCNFCGHIPPSNFIWIYNVCENKWFRLHCAEAPRLPLKPSAQTDNPPSGLQGSFNL